MLYDATLCHGTWSVALSSKTSCFTFAKLRCVVFCHIMLRCALLCYVVLRHGFTAQGWHASALHKLSKAIDAFLADIKHSIAENTRGRISVGDKPRNFRGNFRAQAHASRWMVPEELGRPGAFVLGGCMAPAARAPGQHASCCKCRERPLSQTRL